jgi:hypothetical protein
MKLLSPKILILSVVLLPSVSFAKETLQSCQAQQEQGMLYYANILNNAHKSRAIMEKRYAEIDKVGRVDLPALHEEIRQILLENPEVKAHIAKLKSESATSTAQPLPDSVLSNVLTDLMKRAPAGVSLMIQPGDTSFHLPNKNKKQIGEVTVLESIFLSLVAHNGRVLLNTLTSMTTYTGEKEQSFPLNRVMEKESLVDIESGAVHPEIEYAKRKPQDRPLQSVMNAEGMHKIYGRFNVTKAHVLEEIRRHLPPECAELLSKPNAAPNASEKDSSEPATQEKPANDSEVQESV